MTNKKKARAIIDAALAAGRRALTAPEAKQLCDLYGIAAPKEGLAKTADEAARIASRLRFPVVMKIVSEDILHKTEAGGVIVGLESAADVKRAFAKIVKSAKAYKKGAKVEGVQVQQLLKGGHEVMVGAVTDPSFGKLIGFGLGGVMVEVMKDITFRLAPVSKKDALSMLDGIGAAEILHGVRGAKPVNRVALAEMIQKVSKLVTDFPEIQEVDLNPIFATEKAATAVDVRILVGEPTAPRQRFSRDDILTAMRRIMNPRSVAVIGASAEDGKIGNSVMKNLINGGYRGEIYPIHPKATEILGRKAFPSVLEVGEEIDVAVFAIPARLCAAAMEEVGRKKIPGAVMIPSGFAEVGEQGLQDELLAVARKHNVRVMGPNIYGFYYTPQNLCATFCTP
jgi:acyl-CoA synthetase (NDP forming)